LEKIARTEVNRRQAGASRLSEAGVFHAPRFVCLVTMFKYCLDAKSRQYNLFGHSQRGDAEKPQCAAEKRLSRPFRGENEIGIKVRLNVR
jgi:hypothetical protein